MRFDPNFILSFQVRELNAGGVSNIPLVVEVGRGRPMN